MLQAIHGDELMPVSIAMPEDVRILHGCLCSPSAEQYVANCGTAMRFLTAYWASRPGSEVVLRGSKRMHERPIGRLVDALRSLGADIAYLGQEGYPPLRIRGRSLLGSVALYGVPSSQFVSALLLIGIQVDTDCTSPYVEMTRRLIAAYPALPTVEADWSAAAFWYEYVALHGGELLLQDLRADSLQGDRVIPMLFAPLGVRTVYRDEGVCVTRCEQHQLPSEYAVDFSSVPDTYPALALTCERLGVSLRATGVESLPLKECNRLEAVRLHEVRVDHRMAMALLAADWPVDDVSCIAKSYPHFYAQLCLLNG